MECISEVFPPPAVIIKSVIRIQKSKKKKKRLILDLCHVNQYLFKSKFRCKNVSVAREVLNPADFADYMNVKIYSLAIHSDLFKKSSFIANE